MTDSSTPLPRGRHGIDRDEIRRNQRQRLVDATIECVAERGYAATTVGNIVARARVSRETFYELFTDKEDCYRASLVVTAGSVTSAFSEAIGGDDRPTAERLEDGLRAYFRSLAARPAVATCFLLERPPSRDRTSEEVDLRDQTVDWLGKTFGWTDRFAVHAYLSMVTGLIEHHVRRGEVDRLEDLLPDLMPVVRRVLEI